VWAQVDSVWSRTYGGAGGELLTDLCGGPDGGTLLCGFTNSSGAGFDDLYLISLNAQGDTLWTRTYGGPGNERCGSLVRRDEGGYFATCFTGSFGGDLGKIWVMRLTDAGDTLWSHAFEAQLIYSCPHVALAADGGCMLAVSGGADVELVRYAANGDSLWSRRYGSRTIEECHDLIRTSDGGYLLGGLTYAGRAASSNCWLLRTNADGDSLWQTIFGRDGEESISALLESADGHIYAVGPGTPLDGQTIQVWLTKLSARGDSLGSVDAGTDTVTFGEDLLETADGGMLIAGGSRISFNSPTRFWLKEFNSDLSPRWDRVWGDNQMNWPERLLAQPNGFLFASTLEAGPAGGTDYFLQSFGTAEAAEPKPRIPEAFALSNYPNPFNPQTEIEFKLPREEKVSLTVYNVFGQQVATLIHGTLAAGTHHALFDGASQPSGIYFYSLSAGTTVQTRKMILLK
jgi:hypothetical protein